MKILTLENRPFKLEKIPEWVDEKLRFAVLDNSDPGNPDFFYIPLIFLESFNAPAAVLEIGQWKIKMPLDWKMLIGEQGQPEMHVLPITSLNDRGFKSFIFNPLTGFLPTFAEIEIVNIYQEVKWYFPKLKFGHILAVPLFETKNSPCIFFVKETNKIPDVLSTEDLW